MKGQTAVFWNRVTGSWSKSHLIVFLLFLMFVLFQQPAYGQDSPVTVSVNRTHFSTDELVILTVTAVDDSPRQPRPVLPKLDGLAVVDLDIATNVSLVRGQIQTEVIYTYELQPRRTGKLTIPPIPVQFNTRVVETAPVSIEVEQGAPPAPSPNHAVAPGNIKPPNDLKGQDFYVEAVVDEANPYVGQQLTYTFRFYQSIQLYRKPQLEMPIFNGFETLGMPVQEYNLEVAGQIYLVSEIRMALFPKSTGLINIGAAQLIFPGSFFDEAVELYTKPIKVEVKPLPDAAPSGFNGAVGRYEIKAWFSPQVAVINQPSTLSVAVSGEGNISSLPDPIWPSLHQWRTYDSLTSQSTDIKNGQMVGTRVYERLLVSNELGDLAIPPAKLVYFDPVAKEYRMASSRSIKVRVIAPPTPDSTGATATAVAALSTATPVALVGPLEPNSQVVNPNATDLLAASWRMALPMGFLLILAVCVGLPAAAFVGAGSFWMWQKQQGKVAVEAVAEDEVLTHPKQSMHPVLIKAMARNDDNYKATRQALVQHLSQLLGTTVKGLTRPDLSQRLEAQGLSKAQIDRVNDCLAEGEVGQFGPKTDDAGWELLAKTDELLFELDRHFSSSS